MPTDADDLIAEIEEHFKEYHRKNRPSSTITVYCDKHLGVKMALGGSWSIGEYGESSADVNPLEFWRCQKEGCARCFEPTMFGYTWHSGEMGSRFVFNP